MAVYFYVLKMEFISIYCKMSKSLLNFQHFGQVKIEFGQGKVSEKNFDSDWGQTPCGNGFVTPPFCCWLFQSGVSVAVPFRCVRSVIVG